MGGSNGPDDETVRSLYPPGAFVEDDDKDFPPIEVLQDSASSPNGEEEDAGSIIGVEKGRREPLFLPGSDDEDLHQDEKRGGDGEYAHFRSFFTNARC